MATVRVFVLIALVTLFFCDVNAPQKGIAVRKHPPLKIAKPKRAPAATSSKTAQSEPLIKHDEKKVKQLELLGKTVALITWKKDIVKSFLNRIIDLHQPRPEEKDVVKSFFNRILNPHQPKPEEYDISIMLKPILVKQLRNSKLDSSTLSDCIEASKLLDVPWVNNFIFSKIKNLPRDDQKLNNFKIAIANVVEEHLCRIKWLISMTETKKVDPEYLKDDFMKFLHNFSFIRHEDKIMPLVKKTKISLYPSLGAPSNEELKLREDFVTDLKTALKKLIKEQDGSYFNELKIVVNNLIITEAFLVQIVDLKQQIETGTINQQNFRGQFNDCFYNLVREQMNKIQYDIDNIFKK